MIPFAEHCSRVEAHIEHAYRIRVVTVDVPDPLTGDLDGAEIHLDFALTPEQRLFLLGHLFGHTVQWNVNPRAFEIGKQHEPPVSEELLPSIMDGNLDDMIDSLRSHFQAEALKRPGDDERRT